MIDIGKFLKLLIRNAFALIVVPVVTVIITYFLVRQLPNEYLSKSRIATGLVEQSEQIIDNLSFLQESRIDQEFSNIMQVMQLKRIYDQVSYQLILHDLTRPDSAFRKKSRLMNDLNPDAIRHAIQVYSEKYEKAEPLVLWDRDQAGLKQVLVSMGYDDEALRSKMSIYRVSRSDYIDVDFRSDNPLLSAFVVNQLTTEFIKYYSSVTKTNQVRSLYFLDSLRKNKQMVMDMTMDELKSYKIRNRILNLDEQARVLYGQIADIETKLEVARKDVEGYNGVLKNIDNKFDPNEKKFIENTTRRVNQDIVNSTNQLKTLTDLYIRSNYDPVLKQRIDSLKNRISAQITESADRYTSSPLTTKENLMVQRINAEVGLDMARYSIRSLEQEVIRLNKVVANLVPHEANVQAYEEKIDVASKEYLDALNKFNQSSLSASLATRIRQIELGMPGSPVPSKKMLLVILSGVISFAFCLLVMFVLFYIDANIKTDYELANETGYPVLGTLPFMGHEELDLRRLWNGDYDITRTEEYKNRIRSIRFEITEQMGAGKILVVTSIRPEEGKTFAALNIAYAYSRIGKKVLLVDGHFDKPDLSKTIRSSFLLEDYLAGRLSAEDIGNDSNLTVLASKTQDISIFEIADQELVKRKLHELANRFDIVIIDTPSLRELSKSKEWISVSDKALAVYEAGHSITSAQKQQHIKYLHSINSKFIGWLMNKVEIAKTRRKDR